MKKKIYINYFTALAFAAISALFSGCKKEASIKTCNWDKEYEVFQQRLNSYIANPTKSTCSSLKESALTMLKKLDGCTNVAADAIRANANQWKAMDCNEL